MATFTINGASRSFDGDPDMPLLWYLRDELGLTGTKFGCGGGFCGACTVHVDGKAMRSCQIPMSTIGGRKIVTIEGLSPDQSHPVQRAWMAATSPQCGYCQVGQIMQAVGAARREAASDRRRHRRRHGRQHLPVRHLSAHSSGHQARGGGTVMTPRTSRAIVTSNVSRRHFLGGVFSAGAFVVAARFVPESLLAQTPSVRTQADAAALHPSVYLGIDPDGTVHIVTHRSEMGTGIRTSLPDGRRRRARRRLGARQDRAGHRRRQVRRPEHRRIEIHPRLLRRVPSGRRIGAR